MNSDKDNPLNPLTPLTPLTPETPDQASPLHFENATPLPETLATNLSLPIPQLLLLEQSGELNPDQATALEAWRQANGEPAALLKETVEHLTRPLPDPGVPLHPLHRDHIMKAGRSAHIERRRAESKAAQDPAGKLISPVTPAWEADNEQRSSSMHWVWAVAALAAVFLFGLYVVNRPGPSGLPEIVDVPENIEDPLAHEVPAPMLVNADTIEAFINEPYTDFSSQLSELDLVLFQSQVDLSDESDWLAQLD